MTLILRRLEFKSRWAKLRYYNELDETSLWQVLIWVLLHSEWEVLNQLLLESPKSDLLCKWDRIEEIWISSNRSKLGICIWNCFLSFIPSCCRSCRTKQQDIFFLKKSQRWRPKCSGSGSNSGSGEMYNINRQGLTNLVFYSAVDSLTLKKNAARRLTRLLKNPRPGPSMFVRIRDRFCSKVSSH